MKIGVFCSANQQIDAEYFELTRQLGAWMAAQGHTLVFGGCDMGLMECVARAVKEGGGYTIGIVPTLIERGGHVSDYVDTKILCDNLSDRKDLLLAQSDILVALPGGIGTLDELFTVAASRTIGYHQKRVVLYNIGGFWNSLIALLDDLQAKGIIRGQYSDGIAVANNIEELKKELGFQI